VALVRSAFAALGLALLAGCAGLAPAPSPAPDKSAGLAAPRLDARSKFESPKDGRKRDRAGISAKFHLEMEADENGPPSAAALFRAQAQRENLVRERRGTMEKAAGLQPSGWQAIGPANVGGRVRAIVFDPRDARKAFAGTASGGLWITTDSGATWNPHFDFLPNLSITTIVVDPLAPDTMYLGTGEASAGLVGVGVFKSVDAGRTWQYLTATNPDANGDWRFVNRLAIHPSDPRILLAGVTSVAGNTGGIYRSADGGATWSRAAAFKAPDVAFDPFNPNNAVAGLDDGTIAFSRNAGLTWTKTAALVATPSGRGNTARAEIAFARSQPGTVFASVDNEKGEVWRSDDSGGTWTKLSTPGHLNVQGDYDNTIWVDPFDLNTIVVGGLDLYRSRDGGLSFQRISDWRFFPNSPHADHHALVAPPTYGPGNPVLWNGNDGGVYATNNILFASEASSANGWTNLNNGLAVTQFYSGAGRTAAGGRIVGGTQDNGSLALSAGQWRIYRGGDGGTMAVDPANDAWIFGEYVYLALHRSNNGGGSSQYICNGITEGQPDEGNTRYCGNNATKKANFIAPFVLDPNNANRLVAGANSLWVSDDAKAAAPAWRTIKAPSAVTDNFINAIAVAEGNSAAIWVGHNNGELYSTDTGLAPTPSWTRRGQGVLPARRVMRITVDRDDHRRVIVAFTGFTPDNVWQTRDGGATWASITGNLPDAPVFDVKRHPRNANWLYAATSVGVFTSEDGGASWSTTNEGPANIRVRELFWLDDATLAAATYGRGMYRVSVASSPANYQDLWWGGQAENGWGLAITQHGSTLFNALFFYDATGRAQWAVMPGGTWDAGFTTYTGALYIPTGSPFSAYDASRFVAGSPVGTATLVFTGTGSARLDYTINGVSGSKTLSRQPFGPRDTTAVGSFGDLWWGGASQNGWGVTLSQQVRTLFSVWFTYDATGRTTWFVVPGGSWTAANVWSGTAYRTQAGAWAGVPWDPTRLVATPVGTVTYTFDAQGRAATMNWSIDGASGVNALSRQPF